MCLSEANKTHHFTLLMFSGEKSLVSSRFLMLSWLVWWTSILQGRKLPSQRPQTETGFQHLWSMKPWNSFQKNILWRLHPCLWWQKTYFKAKRDCLTTLTKFLILTRAEVLRWHKMKLKIEAKRKSCSRYVFCRKLHSQHPLLQIGLVRGANACKSWKRPAASSLVN